MLAAGFRRLADNSDPGSLAARFRRRRFRWFAAQLGARPGDRILDVGGASATWAGSPFERSVTLLNVKDQPAPPGVTCIVGDGCDMSGLRDGSFDVVFSNSVIEHVGDASRQKSFADEVRRVGRRYWVQTPYRHFPLEAHLLFPFFQYLPPRAQAEIARRWPYSHYRREGLPEAEMLSEVAALRLLDARQMRALFPDGRLIYERVALMPKSLIAFRA
jgi:methyltransferase family protein